MLRATSLGQGDPSGSITLDAESRHIRRKLLTLADGLEILVDVEKPARLRHADCLQLEDGRLIEVIAATEDLT